MPIYDYTCKQCGCSFEERQSIENREVPLQKPCPECQSLGSIEQAITCPAIVDAIRIGIQKAPSDFQKYVLGRIKSSVPGNKIGEKTPLIREV